MCTYPKTQIITRDIYNVINYQSRKFVIKIYLKKRRYRISLRDKRKIDNITNFDRERDRARERDYFNL